MNCVAKDLEITENTIIDPAQGVREDGWNCAIKLANRLESVRILNNAFYTGKEKPVSCGIYDGAENIGNCFLKGNRIAGSGSTGIPICISGPARKGEEWKVRGQ
jgi:hypothetical protein